MFTAALHREGRALRRSTALRWPQVARAQRPAPTLTQRSLLGRLITTPSQPWGRMMTPRVRTRIKFQRPCHHLSRRLSPSSPLEPFQKTTNPWSEARLRGSVKGRNHSPSTISRRSGMPNPRILARFDWRPRHLADAGGTHRRMTWPPVPWRERKLDSFALSPLNNNG